MSAKFTRLTRPAIRSLKTGKRITEHGITAERQRNGEVRYSVDIMVDGQRIHRVVGRESEGVTRQQAEDDIARYRTRAREGRLDLPNRRKTHRTFADAGEEYLTRIEAHPKHGRNLTRKQHHIRERLAPYFKTQRPDKLTDFSIAHYARDRLDEGAAQATVNRELSTLSHFLSRCIEWDWSKSKPKIDKGDEPRKKIVVLSAEERESLMHAGIADQDPQTWLFVAIAIGTAMRHSEVLRVRWDDINFALRRIHVGKAKAGHREQPMPASLAQLLETEWEKMGEPSGYLFPTTRADAIQPHRTSMAKQFKRAVLRAKLDPKKLTPHVLRHTAITALVRAGVDLPTIQKISGHKTLAMVLRYTQLSDAHINSAVDRLDAAFGAMIAPELHTSENVARITDAKKLKKV